MARKKDNKALFEVLSKGEGSSLGMPEWMRKKSQPEEPQPTEETPQTEEQAEQRAQTEEPPAEPLLNLQEEESAPVEEVVAEPEAQPAEEIESDVTVVSDETSPEEDVAVKEDEPAPAEEDESPEDEAEPEELPEEQGEEPGLSVMLEETAEEPQPEPQEEIEDVVAEPETEAETEAEIEEVPQAEETPLPDEPEKIEEEIADEPQAEQTEELSNGGRHIVTEAKPVPSRVATATAAKNGGPAFRVADGRVRLALNMNLLSALVAAVGILVVLIGMFVLGRVSVGTPETTVVTSGGDAPGPTTPAKVDVKPQPAKPVVKDIVLARTGHRDAKRYYIVIQMLKGDSDADKAEADRIIGFCHENGLPADMVNLRGRVTVWCLLGLTSNTSDAARKHVEKVEKVGKKYFSKYKTYDFKQRKKDGRLSAYFILGRYEPKSR